MFTCIYFNFDYRKQNSESVNIAHANTCSLVLIYLTMRTLKNVYFQKSSCCVFFIYTVLCFILHKVLENDTLVLFKGTYYILKADISILLF